MLVRAPAASRALLRSLPHTPKSSAPVLLRSTFASPLPSSKAPITRFCTVALAYSRPTAKAALRSTPLGLRSDVFRVQTRMATEPSLHATKGSHEDLMKQKFTRASDAVSATSSMGGQPSAGSLAHDEAETDMMAGVKQDIVSWNDFNTLRITPSKVEFEGSSSLSGDCRL